jgi:hypothetical protein
VKDQGTLLLTSAGEGDMVMSQSVFISLEYDAVAECLTSDGLIVGLEA